jgi:nucleotide-binding universal stress UspA family protein
MSRPKGEGEEGLAAYETFAREVIRSHEWDVAAKSIARILVPVDFSICSTWALRHAEEVARRFGSELILLHVDPLVLDAELNPERGIAIRKEVDGLVDRLRDRGTTVRGTVRGGAPIEEILRAAKDENVDMIVIGTHGRTGLSHVFLGSVAESVVRKASCPVLTVRHEKG